MYGITDGFDVVIGNPPYVQIQKFSKEQKQKWITQKYQTYAATADIYCLFYERGAQLLKAGGHLCYITSNNWMRAHYGSKLREYLTTVVDTVTVLDFGMGLNFNAAAALTNILLFTKQKNGHQTFCCYAADAQAAMSDPEHYFYENAVHMPELDNSSWVVVTPERYRIKQAVEAQGVPLEDWDLKINYGIKTGFNKAFYLTQEQRDELIAREPQAKEIIVPLLRGRYVGRYKTDWDHTWMINTHNGVKSAGVPQIDVQHDFPIIYEHLTTYQTSLEKRQDKGDHWSNLRNCAYHKEFRKPKIIYPNMTKYLPFFYDQNDYFFINDKAFIMTSGTESLQYLVAMLNSCLFRYCFRDNFPELLGNTYEIRKVFVEKIPIKKPDIKTASLFETLVDYVQFVKADINQSTSNDTPTIATFLEELIDACVMEVYFADHMTEKKLTVMAEANQVIRPFPKSASNSVKWQQIQSFYDTFNAPQHPIRDRLARFSTDSPDLLRVIKEEGKV